MCTNTIEHNRKYAAMFEKKCTFDDVVILVLRVFKMYQLIVKIVPNQIMKTACKQTYVNMFFTVIFNIHLMFSNLMGVCYVLLNLWLYCMYFKFTSQ